MRTRSTHRRGRPQGWRGSPGQGGRQQVCQAEGAEPGREGWSWAAGGLARSHQAQDRKGALRLEDGKGRRSRRSTRGCHAGRMSEHRIRGFLPGAAGSPRGDVAGGLRRSLPRLAAQHTWLEGGGGHAGRPVGRDGPRGETPPCGGLHFLFSPMGRIFPCPERGDAGGRGGGLA